MNDYQQTELLEAISIAIDILDRICEKPYLKGAAKDRVGYAYSALADAYQKVGEVEV